MQTCAGCGEEIARSFRFCPWCAAPQRTKIVEFFEPHPAFEQDRGKALRVSHYLEAGHVRFSVWNESGIAEAALSLAEAEAARLAVFLGAEEADRDHSWHGRLARRFPTIARCLRDRPPTSSRSSPSSPPCRAPRETSGRSRTA